MRTAQWTARQAADVPVHGPAQGHLAPHAVKVLVVLVLFLVLTTLFIVLRFCSRWLASRRFLLAEWCLLIAQVLFYSFCVVSLVALYQGGIGAHISELGSAEVILSLKITLVAKIVYAASMGIVKVSVCLLYLDIFPQTWIRTCSWILIGIDSAWALMTILISLLICRPLSANWDPSTGSCGDQHAAYTAVAGIEMAIDLLIILLPLPVIWNLQMPTGSKVATSSLFCLGLVTIVNTGVRMRAILDIDIFDFSYTSVNVYIWTTVELGVALIVTSAMGSGRLFVKMFPTQKWSKVNRSRKAQWGTAGSSFRTDIPRKANTRMGGTKNISGSEGDTLALGEASGDSQSLWSLPGGDSQNQFIGVRTEISAEHAGRR